MKTTQVFFIVLLFFLVIITNFLFGQEPDTLWTRVIGGDSDDVAYDIEELWDGGFAIAGYTKSISITNYDAWLIRTDVNGNILWSKTYGGNGDDYGYSMKKTDDGGFIIGGATNSFGAGGLDFYLVRTDSLGDTLWTKTFGGINNDICWSVDKTEDGGFVLAGEKDAWPIDADTWIIKTNSSGLLEWEKSYGNDNDDERAFSIKYGEGSFFIVGAKGCNGYSGCDGWLIKIDGAGDTIWTKSFPDIQSNYFYSLYLTYDKECIMTGRLTTGEYSDVWLLKTDSLGNQIWSNNFDFDNDIDDGYSVQQTSDGGYVITGDCSYYDGAVRPWVIKTNSFGDTLWTKRLLIPLPNKITIQVGVDAGLSIKQTIDGGYIITGAKTVATNTGKHNFDIFLAKLEPDIVPVELTNFTAAVNQNVVTLSWQTATETNNSGFEIERRSLSPNPSPKEKGVFKTIAFVPGFGTTTDPKSYSFIDQNLTSGKYQYRLKQIDFDGTFEYSKIVEAEINSPTEFSLEQNYPNPFNPTTKIKYTIGELILRQAQDDNAIESDILVSLKVFDVLGNEVATLVNETQPAGSYEVEFNVGQTSSLSSGVYYYQLRTGGFVETKKMILLR